MQKKGFSLVELSIVLVIIGLLVASVSAGTKLVRNSRLQAVINDVQDIKSSISVFYTTFGYLPGDMPTATTFWSGTGNGDGNALIEPDNNTAGSGYSEASRVFQHMALAETIDGSYTAGNDLESTPAMAYVSPLAGAAYIVTSYTHLGGFSSVGKNMIGGNSYNVIRLGKTTNDFATTSTYVGYGIMSVTEAINIDGKMDDARARSGSVTGHNEYLSATQTVEGCLAFPGVATTSAVDDGSDATYNAGADFLCNMSFDLPDY